jgi:hypothetical protein
MIKKNLYTILFYFFSISFVFAVEKQSYRNKLEKNIPQFRKCYEKELETGVKDNEIVFNLHIIVGKDGIPTMAGLPKQMIGSNELKKCIINVVYGIRFPVSNENTEIIQKINFFTKEMKDKKNQSSSKQDKLKDGVILSSLSCSLSNEDNGTITSMQGDKVDLTCIKDSKFLKCSQPGGIPEQYDLLLDEDGVFFSRSSNGNIMILGDLNRNKFSIALVQFLVEKAVLVTKHCAGVIK